ncbi:MAG: YdeI/OmpD-associated family protein [Myxococcota bacterium]
MTKTENFEKVEVTSQVELRAWLEANHAQTDAVWVVTYKKHTGERYVSTQQILDEVLCFGWIDGIRRKLDDERTMQLIAPRKAQHWAKSYKDRAQRLIDHGLMRDAGFAAIEASKANGMWSFMDDVDALVKPDDLEQALDERPGARAYFDGFPDSSKRFVLRWIKLAKTEKTRAKRVTRIAELAQQNERLPSS